MAIGQTTAPPGGVRLTRLERSGAEDIHNMREVASRAERRVTLHPDRKDTAGMVHPAMKAFPDARPLSPTNTIESTASALPQTTEVMLATRHSERRGRPINVTRPRPWRPRSATGTIPGARARGATDSAHQCRSTASPPSAQSQKHRRAPIMGV
jgi:hypothetical protein